MALEVGTAWLKVIPTTDQIHKRIAAVVKKIRDIELNVKPNMDGFREKVERGTRGVRGVEVDVVANTERARVQVGAFAKQLETRLQTATRALGDIRIDGDATPVERKIWSVRQQLATLQNQRIGIDVDAATATAKIGTIQAELTALGRRAPNIQVRVDTAAAVAQLAALRAAVGATDRVGVQLGNTFGGGGRGRGISGMLRNLVSSAVAAGGAFAELAGAGIRAVSSFSSVASGGTGLAGVFTSMAPAAGSAATAMGSLTTAIVPLAAAAVGIAAVGSVAVAALGQLGGAVIAVASGIVPLVGLLGTLPGLLIPVGLAVGALAIAFGDAGLKAEVEKLKTAFTPLINDIRNQLRPALTELLTAVAELAPVFQKVAPVITSALSDVARGFSDILKSSTFKTDLESLMTSAGATIRGLGTAAQDAFRGLTDMAIAAQPAVASLVGLIQEGAAKFAAFTAEGRRTGELAAFFQQGVDVLRQMLDVVGNLGGLLKDMWDSANRTGAFKAALDAINTGITQFRDYVSQAGGSWDQLMAKVGPITTSIVGLVKSIGRAFVELGASTDVASLIDKISDSITRVTPAFKEIAAVAVPAIEQVIEAITRLVEKFGPNVADTIRTFSASFDKLSGLGPIFSGIGTIIQDVISSILIAVEAVSTAIDGVVSIAKAGWQALTGDFAGAAETMRALGERTGESIGRIGELSGLFGDAGAAAAGATPPVSGLGTAIQGIPDRTVVIDINTTSIAPEINTVKAFLNSVPESKLTKFFGDYTNIAAAVGVAVNETATVPEDKRTSFSGDAAGVTGAAGTARSGIASVLPEWLTRFLGDTAPLLAATMGAGGAIAGVPTSHNTGFLGNSAGVLAAVGQSIGSINSVPGAHDTALRGDPSGAVGAANTATGAINGVPPEKSSVIRAQDLASSVIRGIISALNAIPRFITTVVRTVTGGSGGLIMSPMQAGGVLAPMQAGGVLPMARGDNLTPMSGNTARIVPPNTWRVIGDRMTGDEAFIPINRSPWSAALLAETADRMGYAVTPMAHGGVNSRNWRDPRTWDWLRKLLGSLLKGRPGGGVPGTPTGPGGGVGGIPGLAPTGMPMSNMLTSMYQSGTGLASMTRANPRYSPTPWSAPARHADTTMKLDLQFRPSGNRFIDALLEEVARAVRARGGDPQQFFGQR